MLIVFKSKAAGDVMMFGDVAERMLALAGKPFERQGIFTVEQLPDAIARLKIAMQESKAEPAHADEPDHERTPAGDRRPFVSLAVRAVPLIELFERSLKAGEPVTWGV